MAMLQKKLLSQNKTSALIVYLIYLTQVSETWVQVQIFFFVLLENTSSKWAEVEIFYKLHNKAEQWNACA